MHPAPDSGGARGVDAPREPGPWSGGFVSGATDQGDGAQPPVAGGSEDQDEEMHPAPDSGGARGVEALREPGPWSGGFVSGATDQGGGAQPPAAGGSEDSGWSSY